MTKSFFGKDRLDTVSSASLIAGWIIGVFALLYFFYFVLIQQSWSLIDDYGNALLATSTDFHPLTYFKDFNEALLKVGRFKPVSNFMVAMRLWLLPTTPRAFHLYQYILTTLVFASFYWMLKTLGVSTYRRLVAVILAAFAFSVKDMILYSTASESMLVLFFFLSVGFFLSRRKVLSLAFFVFMLLTKEPSLALISVFPVLLLTTKGRALSRSNVLYLCLLGAIATTFILYVRQLPRLYTAGFGLSRVTTLSIATAFFVPVIKNYAVVIIALIGLHFLRKRKPADVQKRLAFFGLTLAAAYTVILSLWGPFDSWSYLHIPIPFGWAAFFAAFWPDNTDQGANGMTASATALGIVSFFGIAVILNGATNYYIFLKEAKQVAEQVCEETMRNPALRAYSNCYEGSVQMRNYLELEHKCPEIPNVEHLSQTDLERMLPFKSPFIFIYSPKCDYAIPPFATLYKSEFQYWTIFKDLGDLRKNLH